MSEMIPLPTTVSATAPKIPKFPILASLSIQFRSLSPNLANPFSSRRIRLSSHFPLFHCPAAMDAQTITSSTSDPSSMKLLFVEMGVGYDHHGQDITGAAIRACRDAITSNSIPAFRRGSIPGVTFEQMKLKIKLGVPHSLHQFLDIDMVNGKIVDVEVSDGDKNDDCYIVNAAVYVGY